jgi:uncharacterized membrane protein YedE/YeeE
MRSRGSTLPTNQPTAETRAATPNEGWRSRAVWLLPYLFLGTYLGIVFTKSEVVSWYRIQEMFRFQSFHMYGIITSAVIVATVSVLVIKRMNLRTLAGRQIRIPPKQMTGVGYRYWMGGVVFGVGWALLGACPGPIFALIGNGVTVIPVSLASAVMGTWTYGYLRPRLPH